MVHAIENHLLHHISLALMVQFYITAKFQHLFVIVLFLFRSIFGDLYYKILLGYAAENFVCLQQRLSKPQLRLKYLKKLLLEDCSHNILYSLILYFYHPLPCKFGLDKIILMYLIFFIFITKLHFFLGVWLPILLFAILHAANHPWFDKVMFYKQLICS